MSRIKIGAEIKNYLDFKNLIINLINSLKTFDIAVITRLSFNYLENSPLNLDRNQVFVTVDEMLDLAVKYGYISYSNEIYTLDAKLTIEDYFEFQRKESATL